MSRMGYRFVNRSRIPRKVPGSPLGSRVRRLLSIVCLVGLLFGCGEDEPAPARADRAPSAVGGLDSGDAPAECVPPEQQERRPALPSAYAAMCEPHVGVAPAVDCGEGPHMPVYVDGVEVFEDPGPFNCDNPHAGQCTPGSSLRRHPGVAADCTPLPGVVWVSLCRHDNQSEDAENHVQLIGHNTETGATCFFGRADNSPWTAIDGDGRMVGQLPGPDDPGFDVAYAVPDTEPCVGCHISQPFIHTAWIKSAVGPDGERVVPVITGNDAPYFVVGAPEWDMRTLHIEGNACLDCHRVGMDTIRLLAEDPWYPEVEMPPADPGSMADDYAALVDCWYAGPDATPGCDWVLPPAGACASRVADAGYPNASDWYNQGHDLDTPPFPTQSRAAAHGGHPVVGLSPGPIAGAEHAAPD